jgi:hypothetical protein
LVVFSTDAPSKPGDSEFFFNQKITEIIATKAVAIHSSCLAIPDNEVLSLKNRFFATYRLFFFSDGGGAVFSPPGSSQRYRW